MQRGPPCEEEPAPPGLLAPIRQIHLEIAPAISKCLVPGDPQHLFARGDAFPHQPLAVVAMGGKYAVKDNREVPDTLEVLWTYPGNTLVSFTQVNTNAAPANANRAEIVFCGTKGTMYLSSRGWEIVPDVLPVLKNALPSRIALECDFVPPLPRIRIARHVLTQIVFNLVQNAGEAMVRCEHCGLNVPQSEPRPRAGREVRC